MISDDHLVQMQEMDQGDEENNDTSYIMEPGVNTEILGGLPDNDVSSARTIILAKRKQITKSIPLPRSKLK